MRDAVDGIEVGTDVSAVTATSADVVEGKMVVSNDGEVHGSIPDNEQRNVTLDT